MSKFFADIRQGYEPKPDDWNAVEDCLPGRFIPGFFFDETSLPVLVLAGGYDLCNMQIACLCRDDAEGNRRWVAIKPGVFPINLVKDLPRVYNVTHWRWLPTSDSLFS